jgi:hypothetical protein
VLLSKGIDSIVRIGGRSKSKALEAYNLRELASSGSSSSGGGGGSRLGSMSQAEFRRMCTLRDEDRELESKVCAVHSALRIGYTQMRARCAWLDCWEQRSWALYLLFSWLLACHHPSAVTVLSSPNRRLGAGLHHLILLVVSPYPALRTKSTVAPNVGHEVVATHTP